jgi:hypothetical protein
MFIGFKFNEFLANDLAGSINLCKYSLKTL